jgi:hypothetical protein
MKINNFVFRILLTGIFLINGCRFFSDEQSQAENQNLSQCPETLSGLLQNTTEINLTNETLKESGRIKQNELFGYIFEGKAGQKLHLKPSNDICFWVYAPDFQIVRGNDLPLNGKYTIQITTFKKIQDFTLEMSLDDETIAIVNSPLSQPSPSSNQNNQPISSPRPTNNNNNNSNSNSSTQSLSEDEQLDQLADRTFYEKHPELRGRKIEANETNLIQEWKQIRNCEARVDYLFYQKHPELGQRKLRKNETTLVNEWLQIKSNLSACSQQNTVASTPKSSPSPVIVQTSNNQEIDQLADRIFYERHPELRGRKIQANETYLAQEWQTIRNCEAIVDYKFYQKHPELQGRKIRKSETTLAQEWLQIKRTVSGCN